VDATERGFRLHGNFRLRRGQAVELILDEDPLSAVRCSVVWIGKPDSKQAGEVGLETVKSSNPPPPCFSQVLILKVVKVLCFDTLLQVFILKVVRVAGSVFLQVTPVVRGSMRNRLRSEGGETPRGA